MNIDQWIKLLGVIVPLIQTLIWPALILFALLYLGKPLISYIQNLLHDPNVSEVDAEVGTAGVKLRIRKIAEMASNLTLAAANQVNQSPESGLNAPRANPQQIADLIGNVATSRTIRRIQGSRVLWVDDHPENNVYEKRALEALGIRFTLSISTEDALQKAVAGKYAVIISDMGRQPLDPAMPYDKQAGYDLLEKLRKQKIRTPFIIYAGSNSEEHQRETKRRGGFGTTNNAQELFQLVINALEQGAAT